MKLNYILPLLKSVLLMSVILMLVYNNANVIKAETNGQETVTDTSGWSDYDVPGRTGVNMKPETTCRIAREFPNIVAIKEASGSLGKNIFDML